MAFLVYRKSTESVVTWHESEEDVTQPGSSEDLVIIEMDYDPSVDYSLALTLSEDGTTLINKYPGLSLEDQKSAYEDDAKLKEVEKAIKNIIDQIDSEVKNRLKDSEWRLVRARDNDLINGNTEETDALLAARQEIRDNAKAHKALANSITTLSEINTFDHTAF